MMKKKPVKNYVILGCIYLLVIFLVLYLVQWYQAYQDYQMQVPVIRDVLQELLPSEVEHYLLEEPDTLLYVCSAQNQTCRDFEKDFRYYVKQKGLESTIIYLNATKTEEQTSYLESFQKNNGLTMDEKMYPMLLQFEEGTLKYQASQLSLESTKEFLKARGYE